MGQFARNQWYAAAWLSELGETPLARRILDEPVVLFRDAAGAIAALADRCQHRLVPLSMGTVTARGLQCGYHGMTFDGAGRCVHIPGQAMIPPRAVVRSYPLAERYGIAFIWMGEADKADPAMLIADTVTIAVQVMGRLRGTISVPPDAAREANLGAAKAEANVARALQGKRIVKEIYVPNRIVNFVVAE